MGVDDRQDPRLNALRDHLHRVRASRGGRRGQGDVDNQGQDSGCDKEKKSQPLTTPKQAAQVAVDFVASVGVGAVIGIAIDTWFSIQPWGLIVFFILGAAAGMMNVYRIAAGYDRAVGYRKASGFHEDNPPAGHRSGDTPPPKEDP